MCAPYQCAQSKNDIGNNSQTRDNVQSPKTTDGLNQINYALRITNCELDIANSVNAAACFFLPEKQAPQVVFSCGALTIKKL